MNLNGKLEMADVRLIEQRALHAWPALDVEVHDGWLLRFAHGVTRRANSVWPNELRTIDELGEFGIEERMTDVERYYHRRDLPARYQICPAAVPATLDELLAQRSYRVVATTAVQTANLSPLAAAARSSSDFNVEVTDRPEDSWWQCYAEADEVSPHAVAIRKQICARISVASAYAMVEFDGKVLAVGSAAVENGWIGFFNIATLAEHRRKGAARTIIAALAKWGLKCGAFQAYLQVMADNRPALAIYSKLGFTTGYTYHYREEVRA